MLEPRPKARKTYDLPDVPRPGRVRRAHNRTSDHHISLHHTMKIRGRSVDREVAHAIDLDAARAKLDRVPVCVIDNHGTGVVVDRDLHAIARLAIPQAPDDVR